MTRPEAFQICELGINVDHVATVREARQTTEPDPVSAALDAEIGGADQIVLHLRKDRRHVQERDLELLSRTIQTKLNLEMSTDPDIVDIALEHDPDRVTIVPERRDEVTTEGGLDAEQHEDRLSDITQKMNAHGLDVNLFIDPVESQIDASNRIDAQGIELHTGPYANAGDVQERADELETLSSTASYASELGLFVAAGHGLNYQNAEPVASISPIRELNIGHSIVSRSIRTGMEKAVRDMVDLIHCAT
jgi:pyridoxine 5-phosphate synthase